MKNFILRQKFSNVYSKAFISCYHFPHSVLSLCLHSKYIFFVSKRSVKYGNFGLIWFYIVVNDHLVFIFQKLADTLVTLCQRECTLEKKILDGSGPVECLFSKYMFFYINRQHVQLEEIKN